MTLIEIFEFFKMPVVKNKTMRGEGFRFVLSSGFLKQLLHKRGKVI